MKMADLLDSNFAMSLCISRLSNFNNRCCFTLLYGMGANLVNLISNHGRHHSYK